jgi:glyoxylase-like metal-dependent hydrolase (beta-lactamase superfamily II)/rhodanese-related sulfurtransferase
MTGPQGAAGDLAEVAMRRQHPFPVARVPGDLAVMGITDDGLGNTSWAVGLDGEVLVVDPERDPEPYLAVAEDLGGQVVLAAETHLHADFVTGSRELAAHGADVVASAAGRVPWDHRPIAPGEQVDLGRWTLRALATPGHTPEHVAYLLADRDGPRAVFTGGSLLVGAVGRADLIDPADTEALTRALWRSVNRELLTLPDDVTVFPTHGAGSFCSAAAGGRRWTTIGEERRTNPLLQVDDEDRFVRAVLDSLGSFPPYFLRLREVNRLGPHVFGALPLLDRLTVAQVVDLRDRAAVIVDARPVADYAHGHIPGSLANTLRPQFASWLGWLVEDSSRALVFVTDAHTDRRELVRQCLNIGYENLAGEIGIEEWRAADGGLTTTPVVRADGMDGRQVVDVRQTSEFALGHVPGAAHIELGSLPDDRRSLTDGPLVVMCGHGERAATAASVLEAAGHADVAVLDGGPGDWAAAHGRDLER